MKTLSLTNFFDDLSSYVDRVRYDFSIPDYDKDNLTIGQYRVDTSDDIYTILINTVGFSEENLSVEYNKSANTLEISGEVEKHPLTKNAKELSLKFKISDKFDTDRIAVIHFNGLLEISIPIAEETKPSKVKLF